MSRLFEVICQGETSRFGESDLPLSVGPASSAHVPLSGGSEQAGWLALADGHLFFQPAPAAPLCLHNGTRVTDSVWLKSGDQLRIGEQQMVVRMQGDLVELHLAPTETMDGVRPVVNLDPGGSRSLPRTVRPPDTVDGKGRLLVATGIVLCVLLSALTLFLLRSKVFTLVIEPQPETVKIIGFPPVVYVQGRYLGWPGPYTVSAWREGYEPLQVALTVDGQERESFHFRLTKLPGYINVTSEPAEGVRVTIDEHPAGKLPLLAHQLAAGVHTLSFGKERYEPLIQEVDVQGMGRTQDFHFTLQPAWGMVEATTSPPATHVYLGDQLLGKTPGILEVPAGQHLLRFSATGYQSVEQMVVVQGGETTVMEQVVLYPVPASVSVVSRPDGAAVTVDGIYRGQTPLTLELPVGEPRTLEIRHPGHRKAVRQIQPAAGEELEVQVTLEQEMGVVFVEVVPADARMSVNGQPVDNGAVGRLLLPAEQEHRMVFSLEGYRDKQVTVIPRKGYSRQVQVTLDPLTGNTAGVTAGKKMTTSRLALFTAPVEFTMGASRREQGRRANEQLHRVKLVRPVYVSAHEVTNGEFRRFRPGHRSGSFNQFTLDGDTQPVVNVSWEDAARYCNWLSKKEGLAPYYEETAGGLRAISAIGTGYRLPTEAEWAYGARLAGRQEISRYPWGGPFPPRKAVGNYADQRIAGLLRLTLTGYDDGYPVSAPVGMYAANPAGRFDMGGNVAEWCHDYYSFVRGDGATAEVDPRGPKMGAHHVVRDASWRDGSVVELRLSYRSYEKDKRDDLGFRVARYLQ